MVSVMHGNGEMAEDGADSARDLIVRTKVDRSMDDGDLERREVLLNVDLLSSL